MTATDWVGLLGGAAGFLALVLQGLEYWKKRKPDLQLFVPYAFSGTHAGSQKRIAFLLIRISNRSERPAFLYLETLAAEVRCKDEWFPTQVVDFPRGELVQTDLPEELQRSAGVTYIPALNRFDGPSVSLDSPYARYLALLCADGRFESADGLRLRLQDCNLNTYCLEAQVRQTPTGVAL